MDLLTAHTWDIFYNVDHQSIDILVNDSHVLMVTGETIETFGAAVEQPWPSTGILVDGCAVWHYQIGVVDRVISDKWLDPMGNYLIYTQADYPHLLVLGFSCQEDWEMFRQDFQAKPFADWVR